MKKAKTSLTIMLALILLLTCLACRPQVANASSPPAEHRYVREANPQDGDVRNWEEIENETDGIHAEMFTWTDGYASFFTGQMSYWAVGKIWVHCHKDPLYSMSGLIVYIFNSTNQWEHAGNINVADTPQWMEISTVTEPQTPAPPGYADEPFLYIALACMSTNATNHNHIYIDAVAAEPYSPPVPPFPRPPSWYPITVNIVDNSGNPLAGHIYIDDYLAGYTSTTIYLLKYQEIGRPYQLYVTAEDSANYVFQSYTLDIGGSTTNNPTPIYVTQPATVTAHFVPYTPPPPNHDVTVAANPGPNGYNVLAIDGITHSLGTTWSLPEGNHQISVASYVYCGYYAWGFDYFTCNGNTYYSNSINLPIYADTTVIAHYTLYY